MCIRMSHIILDYLQDLTLKYAHITRKPGVFWVQICIIGLYNFFKWLNLYINLACLGVCLFVSNKHQNGWTDRAQIFVERKEGREASWISSLFKFSYQSRKSQFKAINDPKWCETPCRKINCAKIIILERIYILFI